MEWGWHAQNLFHNDSLYTQSAATAPAKGNGMDGGAEWRHHGQAPWKTLQGGELHGTF